MASTTQITPAPDGATSPIAARQPPTPEQQFGARVAKIAKQQCERLLGTEAGAQAAQRITMAILATMQNARDPKYVQQCTDLSIATCIALSAQTRLLPGGPFPPVYLVPQAARKGEAPSLQWRLNHRGIGILAYRAGFVIRAVPVRNADFLRVSLGEVVDHREVEDGEWPTTLDDIKGVAVVVRDLARNADVARAFVPRAVIERRRAKARDLDIWTTWPIEMAQGAAIRYLLARGSVPIDSAELAVALATEHEQDDVDRKGAIDVVAPPPRTGMNGLRDAMLLADTPAPTKESLIAQIDALCGELPVSATLGAKHGLFAEGTALSGGTLEQLAAYVGRLRALATEPVEPP